MKQVTIGSALLLFGIPVHAACPALDGNWLLQTSLNNATLERLNLGMASTVGHLTIAGGRITFNRGAGSTQERSRTSNVGGGNAGGGGGQGGSFGISDPGSQLGSFSLSVLSTGVGTARLNAAKCRLILSWSTDSLVYVSDNQNSDTSQQTIEARGRGDYVKITQGFSGKFTASASGRDVAGTFEMSRE